MNERDIERVYQEGRLQAEKDGGRALTVCPTPEGTDEAKWWHRGYDAVVALRDRGTGADARRELGLARQRLSALEDQLQAVTRRYELELAASRGLNTKRADWQSVASEAYATLDRLRGLLGRL